MAAAGFPWQSESRIREPTYLNEKLPEPEPAVPKPAEPLNNVTNTAASPPQHAAFKRCFSPPQPSGRRRNDSLKTQTNAKATVRQSAPLQNWGPREGPTQIPVRTLPAWIQDAEESDLETIDPAYLDQPDLAFLAQHNHSPYSPRRPPFPGSPRENKQHPTSAGDWRPERTSRWISFGRASVYPRENFNNEKVDPEWLNKNFTDYSQPWLANHDEDDEEEGLSRYRAFRKKRQAWYKRFQFTILRNPFIPLAFRLTVIIFAVTAIALGASIYEASDRITRCLRQPSGSRDDFCVRLVGNGNVSYYRDPSALMAIIVDVISVVYTSYITYDEYFSKPLGLRRARAKIRLVLLDLFFIVFQAANLSLSFESLALDEGACAIGDGPTTDQRFERVCGRQQSLSGVLLVSLVAWMLTFSVSVLR